MVFPVFTAMYSNELWGNPNEDWSAPKHQTGSTRAGTAWARSPGQGHKVSLQRVNEFCSVPHALTLINLQGRWTHIIPNTISRSEGDASRAVLWLTDNEARDAPLQVQGVLLLFPCQPSPWNSPCTITVHANHWQASWLREITKKTLPKNSHSDGFCGSWVLWRSLPWFCGKCQLLHMSWGRNSKQRWAVEVRFLSQHQYTGIQHAQLYHQTVL